MGSDRRLFREVLSLFASNQSNVVDRIVSALESGDRDGPNVLVGDDEYTLHEADVLIAALTELVDEGRGVEVTAPVVPRMRQPGP